VEGGQLLALYDPYTVRMAPVVTITSPGNNSTFNAGTPIHVTATASAGAGTGDSILKVAFYAGAVRVAEDSLAPYELTATDVEPGLYLVTARAYGSLGDSAVSDTVRVTVTGCTGTGSISGEGFTDIPGTSLINLASSAKYPNHPDVTAQLNKFEYGPNIGDNYGARVRGYVCAPVTGNYIFYLASDDQSELWLSTDDNPANIVRIAYLPSAVGFRSWYINASQRSAPIRLVKGVRYYIETVHKEGTGNDHLSVGWVLPGGRFEGPIAGSSLSPFNMPVIPADSAAPAAAPDFTAAMRNSMQAQKDAQSAWKELTVTATPNPTPDQFNIVLHSNSDAPVSLKIVDVAGRILELRERLSANATIQIGGAYRAGIYFVEATQGDKKVRLKLLKQ